MTDQIVRSTKNFGAVIQRARKALGITQAQLGDRTQLRQATISTLEDGAPATQLATVMAALAAMDLELVVRHRTKGTHTDVEDMY